MDEVEKKERFKPHRDSSSESGNCGRKYDRHSKNGLSDEKKEEMKRKREGKEEMKREEKKRKRERREE